MTRDPEGHRNPPLLRRIRDVGLVLLTAATVAAVASPATAAASAHARADDALITVSPHRVAVGEGVAVVLSGWPAGVVELAVCGGAPAVGSDDCDLDGTRAVAVPPPADGRPDTGEAVTGETVTGEPVTGEPVTVETVLAVGSPPTACPCVVRATHRAAGLVAEVDLALDGVDTRPASDPPARPTPDLVVVDVQVAATDRSWIDIAAEAAGVRGSRTLTIVVENQGEAPTLPLSWSAAVGRGGEATTVVPVAPAPALAPGERTTLRTPVTLPGPTVGSWTAQATLLSAGSPPLSVTATTQSRPWGWPAVAGALAVVLVLSRRYSGARRRRARRFASADPSNASPATAVVARNTMP